MTGSGQNTLPRKAMALIKEQSCFCQPGSESSEPVIREMLSYGSGVLGVRPFIGFLPALPVSVYLALNSDQKTWDSSIDRCIFQSHTPTDPER
jgi:hypothetical protein